MAPPLVSSPTFLQTSELASQNSVVQCVALAPYNAAYLTLDATIFSAANEAAYRPGDNWGKFGQNYSALLCWVVGTFIGGFDSTESLVLSQDHWLWCGYAWIVPGELGSLLTKEIWRDSSEHGSSVSEQFRNYIQLYPLIPGKFANFGGRSQYYRNKMPNLKTIICVVWVLILAHF